MKPLHVANTAAMFVVLIIVGCQSSRATRIQEHAATFAALDPTTQQIIKDGLFLPGFTQELTYISLGKPNTVSTTETDHGTVEVWKYRNFVYGNIGAMQLSANNPGTKPYGPILSSAAPGGPSLFNTKAGPLQPTIADGSNAPVGTLYLEFLNGRIVGGHIDP